MKYLCDACSRLVTVGAFEVRDGVLALTCPVCGDQSTGAPERPAAPVLELARPRPPVAPGPLCPKCAAPRVEGRDDCPRCGLVFELFNPDDFTVSEPIEARWQALEANWKDPEAHQAFIELCAGAEVLPEMARRYRLLAESDPDDVFAARFRDEVVKRLMAVAALPLTERAERPPRRSPVVRWGALLIMFGAALLVLIYAFGRARLALP